MNKCEENFRDSTDCPQLFRQFVKAYLALHIFLYMGIHKTSNHPKKEAKQ